MAKNLILWVIIALVIIYSLELMNETTSEARNNYVAFKNELVSDQIRSVKINGKIITGEKKSGERFTVVMPLPDDKLLPLLESKNIETVGEKPEEPSILMSILISWRRKIEWICSTSRRI